MNKIKNTASKGAPDLVYLLFLAFAGWKKKENKSFTEQSK